MSIADLAEARLKSRLARARLSADVEQLKRRTAPATLVADARTQALAVVTGRPAIAAGAVAALVAVAAIPSVRRAGTALVRFGWRNRAAIGLLLGARLRGGPAAVRKKDQTR